MRETWTLRGSLAASVLVHAWAIHAAPPTPPRKLAAPPPVVIEFSKQEPAPEVEPEPILEPDPAPEPEPEPVAIPAPAPEVEESAPSDSEAVPEEPASPPPELTGTTLTGEGEASFDAEVGSGRARRGAIRAGSTRASSKPVAARPAQVGTSPKPAALEAIPLAQLSKKPAPPDLGRALEKNFPQDARRQGKSGEAQVRARVEPSGEIRTAQVFFESSGGFGDACKKTLLESKWTAPLDRAGTPVATWVSYRCKFRVD